MAQPIFKKALCTKSFKPDDKYCTGFVKGNYYDVVEHPMKEGRDQVRVRGHWQNNNRETERTIRLLDKEYAFNHLKYL